MKNQESKMKVKLVGRGSDDVIRDMKRNANRQNIQSYNETNHSIPPIKQQPATEEHAISPRINREEYGYEDSAYIRFIYDSIKNKNMSADTGAHLIVLRILKILEADSRKELVVPESITSIAKKITDVCILKLVDMYTEHFTNVMVNNSWSNELLVTADVVIREFCDAFNVYDTTRIQKFQKGIEELF